MKKILAIDDNTINLELLAQITKTYYPDFEFIATESGEEGLLLAAKHTPDLILLDIMMPGMDGFETCLQLKSQSRTRHIPVIMISALGNNSAERTKGLNVGADSFISKPFDQTELKAQINVALRIKHYQERLKKLNAEITLIEERERRRIADNLHDSLGQTLSLAYMSLSSVPTEDLPDVVQDKLKFISGLLNTAIEESRTLTYDLSPPILYELGLVPAVKWKLEHFEKRFKIKTKLENDSPISHVSKSHKVFLFRIINELLTNIAKHANATLVTVEFLTNETNYHIIVTDNGVGIDKSKITSESESGGYGLLSIMERIESINGAFNIEAIKNGTRAEIEIQKQNTKE